MGHSKTQRYIPLMKIYLTEQRDKLPQHIDVLKKKKIMAYERSKLREETAILVIDTQKPIDHFRLDFLFDYKIFPDHIMVALAQWDMEKRRMRVGDTIAQQVYIPPTTIFSQKIVFGVRINEIIDTPYQKGFSYETLEGHVEKGISTFTVEQQSGRIIFRIQTYSAPGNSLTRLLGPVLSVPYQTFCTREALKHVAEQLRAESEADGK